jgi:hypothetical protein
MQSVTATSVLEGLDAKTIDCYRHVLDVLTASGAPYLIGGAYALAQYTGIVRHTKDLDVFCRPQDAQRILAILASEGLRTELTFSHWLGKAFYDGEFIDVIFSSGNGIARVDDEWLEHAVTGELLGLPVRLCPVEESIWSKSFVMERERYDGSDIAHLLRARAEDLDWKRLLRRFGPNYRVLLNYLVLFGFIYPGERDRIPAAVMRELLGRLQDELARQPPTEKICQGTLLTREQFLVDITEWGYRDPRLRPEGPMTSRQVADWTDAIGS